MSNFSVYKCAALASGTIALAFSVGALASGSAAPFAASSADAGRVTQLSPMEVTAASQPAAVQMQYVKKAEHRAWSSAAKDKDVVVCRTPERLGTHFKTLRCQTNAQHSREMRKVQTSMMNALTSGGGILMERGSVTEYNTGAINVSALHGVEGKLPSPDSAGTLVVKSVQSCIISKTVIKGGQVVRKTHQATGNACKKK
jgi:hypothetical protein